MNNERFRLACKFLPSIAWIVSFLTQLPILMGTHGQFGLKCNSRTCTFINADKDENPSKDPKMIAQGQTLVIAILLILMNAGTYLKVSVNQLTQ